MSSIFDDINDFHTKVLRQEFGPPRLLSEDLTLERLRFMTEELEEYYEAARKGDMVEAVDGLLDLIYVAAGTLWFMGIPAQQCWDAVQSANMAKVLGTTHRGNRIDAAKPEGWKPPQIAIAAAIEAAVDRYSDDDHSGSSKG